MLSVAQQEQVYALFNSTLTLVVKCEHFHCCFLYQCFGECNIFVGLDYEL